MYERSYCGQNANGVSYHFISYVQDFANFVGLSDSNAARLSDSLTLSVALSTTEPCKYTNP